MDTKDKVVDLSSFRLKKQLEADVSRGRTPLYTSYRNPASEQPNPENDFAARMQRIRQSLEKINQLMSQIKKSDTKH
ncbi:MAG: hypothetical protein AB7T49_06570 [Oligoflexales bacterium]